MKLGDIPGPEEEVSLHSFPSLIVKGFPEATTAEAKLVERLTEIGRWGSGAEDLPVFSGNSTDGPPRPSVPTFWDML